MVVALRRDPDHLVISTSAQRWQRDYRSGRLRRSLTQVNGCGVPAGVWWVSRVCCSRSKPDENRSAALSALYRAVGRPEHCVGPFSANVPSTKTPPGLIAWVTRSTYEAWEAGLVKKWNTARSCQTL